MPKDKGKTPGKTVKGGLKIDVDLPKEGDTYPAKIVGDIEIKKASDIFGEKAREPDKDMVEFGFEGPGGVEGKASIAAPGITPDGRVIVRNPKSFLYMFVKKYGTGPKPGLPVEVFIDENGFYRVKLD